MNRLKVSQPLGQKDQVVYYSNWYYSAIHVLASIPGFQTTLEICKYLQLDLKKVQEAVEFLVGIGLLAYESKSQSLKVGRESFHLGFDSPLISKHHMNWRLQAIRAIEKCEPDNLHYSSVISISKEDAQIIRETLVKTIEGIKPMVRKSKEEVLKSFSLDFFGI
jgi:predicted transcriptional regulator